MIMISVVIPLFRGNQYVKKLLKNLDKCYQMRRSENSYEIEVIFINDDPKEQIDLKTFGNYQFAVQLIENEGNFGIHYSRIRGLEYSHGEYIHFLDQDDSVDELYYESQLKHVQGHDIVICNGKYRENRIIINDKKTENRIKDANEYFSVLGGIVSPGQALIKKTCIPDAWRKNILLGNYCDDAFLWLLLKNEGIEFTVNREILYYHNENGDNTSFQWAKTAVALEELYEVIEKKSLLKREYEEQLKMCVSLKIKKHRKYEQLEKSFQKMLQSLEYIKTYLIQNNVKTLSIYGYGVYGKKFIKCLEACGIKISYVVDKDAAAFEQNERKLKTLEDDLDKVDLMVITPIFDFEIIKEEILAKMDVRCISLEKFCEFSEV